MTGLWSGYRSWGVRSALSLLFDQCSSAPRFDREWLRKAKLPDERVWELVVPNWSSIHICISGLFAEDGHREARLLEQCTEDVRLYVQRDKRGHFSHHMLRYGPLQRSYVITPQDVIKIMADTSSSVDIVTRGNNAAGPLDTVPRREVTSADIGRADFWMKLSPTIKEVNWKWWKGRDLQNKARLKQVLWQPLFPWGVHSPHSVDFSSMTEFPVEESNTRMRYRKRHWGAWNSLSDWWLIGELNLVWGSISKPLVRPYDRSTSTRVSWCSTAVWRFIWYKDRLHPSV